MEPENQEELINIQNRFERAWNRYVNLTIGSVIIATCICLITWVFAVPGFDPRLIFGVCILTAFAIISFKGLSCPRCGHSLLQFRLNSKPRFCPKCGVSFTGLLRE